VTPPDEPTRLLTALRGIAEALKERKQPWALIGGLAVSIRAEPRFTRDIDLAVAVDDDASAEALVSHLQALGFTLRLSLEQTALSRLATVRLLPPGEPEEGVVIDLLFASSAIEPEICRDAEAIEIVPGFLVPVARAGHLVATKLLAVSPDRPQDEADLQVLLEHLTPEDHARAASAIERIEYLGANRGRSLRPELDERLRRRRAAGPR
jgi:hypothetical protein